MYVPEKYRLELHWSSVDCVEDALTGLEVAVLGGAYFCGPVLKEAARIQDVDSLVLDMTEQHLIFLPEYYQATLSWAVVSYEGNKVFLKDARVCGKYVNSIETLRVSDFILINCEQHEEERHPYYLVYWAKICKEDGGKKF